MQAGARVRAGAGDETLKIPVLTVEPYPNRGHPSGSLWDVSVGLPPRRLLNSRRRLSSSRRGELGH